MEQEPKTLPGRMSLSRILGQTVHWSDGPSGQITDVYFSDQGWNIQFWICRLRGARRPFDVAVPRAQLWVEAGPDRQWIWKSETSLSDALNFPRKEQVPPVSEQLAPRLDPPMALDGLTGAGLGAVAQWRSEPVVAADRHLRSFRVVRTYTLVSGKARVGRIEDFLVDPRTGTIPHLLLQTGHILKSRRVPFDPRRILALQWNRREIYTNVQPFELLKN